MAEIHYRSGCKVAWRTYDNLAEAKAAAESARAEAARKAELGFDFGYQQPGSVTQLRRDGELIDEWEVCFP